MHRFSTIKIYADIQISPEGICDFTVCWYFWAWPQNLQGQLRYYSLQKLHWVLNGSLQKTRLDRDRFKEAWVGAKMQPLEDACT